MGSQGSVRHQAAVASIHRRTRCHIEPGHQLWHYPSTGAAPPPKQMLTWGLRPPGLARYKDGSAEWGRDTDSGFDQTLQEFENVEAAYFGPDGAWLVVGAQIRLIRWGAGVVGRLGNKDARMGRGSWWVRRAVPQFIGVPAGTHPTHPTSRLCDPIV